MNSIIPSITVIVPVYNGQTTLSELTKRLARELPTIASQFELVFVNDDSPDESWEVIQTLSKKYTWVRGIKLMRNYGQHNATLCGVRAAKYDICITMDDDLQHPPEEIIKLITKLQEGFDVVYGSPQKLPQGFVRNFMTSFTKRLLASIMHVPSVRNISAFRAFRTRLRDAFTNFQSPSVTLDVLLSWGTQRFTYVTVNIIESKKRSNYGFKKLVAQTMLILTGFSIAPLRLVSIIGFIMTLFGLAVFIYILVIYFISYSIAGFPFLASLIAILGGAQLFALGIFGEYLGRVFNRSMDRPPYVMEETTEKKITKKQP
jgi:glycosyltransferase involved in cell wall biosynthesis